MGENEMSNAGEKVDIMISRVKHLLEMGKYFEAMSVMQMNHLSIALDTEDNVPNIYYMGDFWNGCLLGMILDGCGGDGGGSGCGACGLGCCLLLCAFSCFGESCMDTTCNAAMYCCCLGNDCC